MSDANLAFEAAAAANPAPMYLVTAHAGSEQSGCLVGFAVQCSIQPLRFLVCLSKANHTHDVAGRATVLTVHPLYAADAPLAHLFGEATGDEIDKFAACDWRRGPGTAIVVGDCDWFAGPVVDRVDLGDHTGFVLDVQWCQTSRVDEPRLSFLDVRHFDPGHPVDELEP